MSPTFLPGEPVVPDAVPCDWLVEQVADHRRRGESIVFTNGCFDLLHIGHVMYLQEAATLGDVLIVAVNSDASVRRLKGASRPFVNQEARSRMVAALRCVDHVIIFDEDTPLEILKVLKPDTLVKGGTYRIDQVVGREIVESYGGRVQLTGAVGGISTSEMVARIRDQRVLDRNRSKF